MKEKIEKIPFYIGVWIVLAAVSTALAGLGYVVTQQTIRMSANLDPLKATLQIKDILKQGVDPSRIIPPTQLELKDNYSVFAAVFDEKGNALSSSVMVDGKTPNLPAGLFENAKMKGENKFTWEPKSNLREAAVVVPYNAEVTEGTSTKATSGFILSGQPLTEYEKNIEVIMRLAVAAWGFCLVLSFILCWALFRNHSKHHHVQEIGETVV